MHADKLNDVITYYFMAQRVKPKLTDNPEYNNYVSQVTLLHEMLIYSMKTKQSLETENISKLKTLLKDFQKAYLQKT